jgi:CheY-like chemotaxis protein
MFKTVLIIDDFQLEYEITKQTLLNNRFAEHVICIDSAMDALLYLCTAQPFPEVIFLDVNMPKKNGFDFLDSYKNFPENARKHCSIVMLSGTNSAADFQRMMQYPDIKKFFRKPLTVDMLNELLDA